MSNPKLIRRILLTIVAVAVSLAASISSPFTANSGPSILILGDSITWGTEYFAKSRDLIVADAQWANVVIDGQYSRRIAFPTPNKSTRYSGVKTYQKLVANGLVVSAVIVALGSNDVALETKPAIYEQVIRELLVTIGNVPITWLTVDRRDTTPIAKRSLRFNKILNRIAADYPNLEIVDWSGQISVNPRWFAWDKVHLTPSGYRARAELHQAVARRLFDRHILATTPTTTIAPETTVPTSETTSTTTVETTSSTTVVP